MIARPQGLPSNRLRHPVGNGIPGRHNWSGTDERTCRFEPLGVPYGMQDSVKWSLAAVRTPRGWVGRYDTYGPKGKTAHLQVVPSLGQEIAPWVQEIQAVKEEAARAAEAARRADTVHQLRRLVPFVEWDKPRPFKQRYTTRREPKFGSETEEEQFYADWEEYLAEREGSREEVNEEDELAHFVQQYFWGGE